MSAQLSFDEALAARDEALADIQDDEQDRLVIDQAIRVFAERGEPFSANELRPLLPNVRTSLIGARFMSAAKNGHITRIGWVRSTDRGTHAKVIGLWLRRASS